MARAYPTRFASGARRGAALVACACAVCLSACTGPSAAADAADGPDSPFWVEPAGRAAKQVQTWLERGREEDAEAMRRIADRPTAVWMTGGDPREQVGEVTREAERAGRIPLLVAYNIPQRDCGQYSSGGVRDAAAYRSWVASAAAGIGGRKAWVVLEPDAIAQWASGCVPASAAGERLRLLSEAVRTFKRQPGTSVYIDAGNAGWISDQRLLAEALTKAGIGQADGFALNVSNFHTTPVTREYGDRLSARLGGAHYIIDTSRNGNGPLPPPASRPGPSPAPGPTALVADDSAGTGSGDEAWCNPPGRALGTPPTTATGDPLVDAFVWVKRPGESDGACRGAPPAGHWWAEYALGLAKTVPSVPAQTPSAQTPPAAPVSVPAPAVPAPAPAPAAHP